MKVVKGLPDWMRTRYLIDPVLPYKEFCQQLLELTQEVFKEYKPAEIKGVFDTLVYSIVEAISRGETAEFQGFAKIEHLRIKPVGVSMCVPSTTFINEGPKEAGGLTREELEIEEQRHPLSDYLTRSELARRLASRAGLSIQDAEEVVKSFFSLILQRAKANIVVIDPLGAFFTKKWRKTIKVPKKPAFQKWVEVLRFQPAPHFVATYRAGLMFPRRERKPHKQQQQHEE